MSLFSVDEVTDYEPARSDHHLTARPKYCRECGHPLKGHKNVKDCPRNQCYAAN